MPDMFILLFEYRLELPTNNRCDTHKDFIHHFRKVCCTQKHGIKKFNNNKLLCFWFPTDRFSMADSHCSCFYTPPHDNGGILWFHVGCPCVSLSVHSPSVHPYFCFQMITWININRFSLNLVCALILWANFNYFIYFEDIWAVSAFD